MSELQQDFHAIGLTGLGICGVVTICIAANYLIHKFHIKWLPESVAAMFIGAALGMILLVSTDNKKKFKFDPSVFFFALLPPIILQAGYSLKRKDFFKNMTAILLYAVFGTIFTAGGMGAIIYYSSSWAGYSMSIIDSLLFGAVLSATESVAVLALLGNKELGADQMLHSLVFGESVFNDAVAIVLFDVLNELRADTESSITSHEMLSAVGSFFLVSFGSLAMGACVGLVACFMMKHLNFHRHPAEEFLLVVMAAFSAYCASEVLGLSGVMALFFTGIVLAHYNWYNLSEASRASTRYGLEAVSFGCETFVFVYLGLTLVSSFHPSSGYNWSPKLIMATILGTFGTRLCVFPFSWIDNLFRRPDRKISLQMQTAIWFSGMRGSVAFALALNMPGKDSPTYGVLVTTTLAVCLFSLLFCGIFLEKLVTGLGLAGGNARRPSLFGAGTNLNLANEGESLDVEGSGDLREALKYQGRSSGNRYCSAIRCFKRCDRDFMKPIFGGNLEDKTYSVDSRFGATDGEH